MLFEAIYLRLRRRPYDLYDAMANIAMYAGYVAILLVWTPILFFIYDAIYQHALFDLGRESPLSPWLEWTLLIVAEDLCFYCFHRASHRVRLLWASHENHHSSTSFNFSVALRQTWTPFLAAFFWLPLPLLGFDPLMILSVQMASLTFQAFLHTELVGTCGLLGFIFNTPGHHRIHHGADADCLDRNFGGVFIFWDRLFGSFHAGRPQRYGIAGKPLSLNPLLIAFAEWKALLVDSVHWRSKKGNL